MRSRVDQWDVMFVILTRVAMARNFESEMLLFNPPYLGLIYTDVLIGKDFQIINKNPVFQVCFASIKHFRSNVDCFLLIS